MRGLWYFLLSILTQVSASTLKVTGLLGHDVTLPCQYDTHTHGVLSLCWGRGWVPVSKCSDTILSSYNGLVDFRQSPRYQLLGGVTDGDVSLTILNAQWSDAGVYGCRVEIPGWFNDYKVNIELVVEEAPVKQPVIEDIVDWTPTTTTGGTQVLTEIFTSVPKDGDVDDPVFDFQSVAAKKDFKAFLGVGDIARMAAICFFTVIVILFFILRKRFLAKRTLQHPKTSTAENIYESAPVA